MAYIHQLLRKLLPYPIKASLRYIKVLEIDYNHFYTARKRICVDRQGNPIPWYTYPAIEYIRQLDFSDRIVFEYGSGNSTLFWGKHAKKVISVEANIGWANEIASKAKENICVRLKIEKSDYINEILNYEGDFDVIVVDGEHNRFQCAQQAIKKLKFGGMIILDNSDHYMKTARILRESGLIQVDMTGFGPIQASTWTTSFFLHRSFDFKPVGNDQPVPGIGSFTQNPEARQRIEGI